MSARSAFSPPNKVAVSFDVSLKRTKESMAAECDINNIMKRFIKSGTVEHLAKHGPRYMAVSAISFHESMNIVRKAEEMFADLPAKVRKKFHHNPAMFLEFVQDPKNLDVMRELGLAKALPEPAASGGAIAPAATPVSGGVPS